MHSFLKLVFLLNILETGFLTMIKHYVLWVRHCLLASYNKDTHGQECMQKALKHGIRCAFPHVLISIFLLQSLLKVYYISRSEFNITTLNPVPYFYFLKIFIVIQLQLFAFSPHPCTPPQPNPPPSPTSTLPLDFVHVSFIVAPVNPSPHCCLLYTSDAADEVY